MTGYYPFARSFLVLITSFFLITIFTGCVSTKTSKTYRDPLTGKTIALQPTIIHGDPSVLNEVIKLDQLDIKPVVIGPLRPYPISHYYAVNHKIEGRVLLLVVINEQGDVVYAETIEPVLGLNEPAVEWAFQLKFRPGEVKGKPVKVAVKLPWGLKIKD